MQVCRSDTGLESLWESNREYLRWVLLRLGGDADLAEDLLQETHIRALTGYAGYRGGDIKAWLGRIARNTFYSHARRHSYSRECFLETDVCADPDLSPGSQAHSAAMDVRQAMSTLPTHLRDVLVMKHFGGWTYEEIGKRSRCSPGTARTRVHRAMERIRRTLGPAPLTQCPSLGGTALLDYLYGVSSSKDDAAIREHLELCTTCSGNAQRIRGVMGRLDELQGTQKITEMLDLDPKGVATLYFGTKVLNTSARTWDQFAFRVNNLSTMLHVTAQGEKVGCEHDRDEYFDWDRGRIVRGRYIGPLPKLIAPGESLDLLTVSRIHPDRCAQPISDGRFHFRWTQFPHVRSAMDTPVSPVAYSQAISLPKGSRLLKAYPSPTEIRNDERTTLIWHSMLFQFRPFNCVVDYRLTPARPDIAD